MVVRRRAALGGQGESPRGVALIVALWVATFFGIAITAFAFSMRTEVDAARSFRDEVQAVCLAEAGVWRGMAEIVNAGTRPDRATTSFVPYDSGEVPLGQGRYRVLVTDDESRISLNQAPAEVLRRLLENTGLTDQDQRETIVDSILDWREPENKPRPHGAKDEYYQALPQPYHAKNGDFAFVEELLLIRGMTRDIFYGTVHDANRLAALLETPPEDRHFQSGEYLGVHQFLTVRGTGRPNVNTASLDVLAAAGVAAVEVEAILASRREGPVRAARLPQIAGLKLDVASTSYVVEATGSVTGATVTHRITVVLWNEPAQLGSRLRVMEWREGF